MNDITCINCGDVFYIADGMSCKAGGDEFLCTRCLERTYSASEWLCNKCDYIDDCEIFDKFNDCRRKRNDDVEDEFIRHSRSLIDSGHRIEADYMLELFNIAYK